MPQYDFSPYSHHHHPTRPPAAYLAAAISSTRSYRLAQLVRLRPLPQRILQQTPNYGQHVLVHSYASEEARRALTHRLFVR